MISSGRSTPAAREKASPVPVETVERTGALPCPRCASHPERCTSCELASSPDPRGGLAGGDAPSSWTANPTIVSQDLTPSTLTTRPTNHITTHAPSNINTCRPHNGSKYNASRRRPRQSWRYRLGQWLTKKSPEGAVDGIDRNDFNRDVRIAYKKDNEPEEVYTASASFDTQCPGDWISASFLKENWDVDLHNNPRTVEGVTVNGEAVNSFGRIWLRWSCRNTTPGWSRGRLSFSPKYYSAWFEVVDGKNFDVIIGQPSIVKHKLVTLNNALVGYHSHRVAIPVATNVVEVQRVQSEADARRANADLRRRQAETNGETRANGTTNSTANSNNASVTSARGNN